MSTIVQIIIPIATFIAGIVVGKGMKRGGGEPHLKRGGGEPHTKVDPGTPGVPTDGVNTQPDTDPHH